MYPSKKAGFCIKKVSSMGGLGVSLMNMPKCAIKVSATEVEDKEMLPQLYPYTLVCKTHTSKRPIDTNNII